MAKIKLGLWLTFYAKILFINVISPYRVRNQRKLELYSTLESSNLEPAFEDEELEINWISACLVTCKRFWEDDTQDIWIYLRLPDLVTLIFDLDS
jgi:hypothetical protein